MTVRLLRRWLSFDPGKRLTLPEALARDLIRRGVAERDATFEPEETR